MLVTAQVVTDSQERRRAGADVVAGDGQVRRPGEVAEPLVAAAPSDHDVGAVGVVDEWTVVLGEDGLRESGEQPVDLLGVGEHREQVDRAVTVVTCPFLRDPDGLASRGSRAQHGARDTGVVGEDRRECGVPAEGEQPQRAAHLHLDVVVAGGGQGADKLGHVSIVGGGEGAGQVPDAFLTRSCRPWRFRAVVGGTQTRRVSVPSSHHASPTLLFPLASRSTTTALRLARRVDGRRVALAFSDVERLRAALGRDVPAARMCLAAAHAMLEPIGVHEVCVDPRTVVEQSSAQRVVA